LETTAIRRRASRGRGTLEIHRLGPHPLIQQFIRRLDVARILDKHIHSNRDPILSHGNAISVLIHNVLVSRDPLYRMSEWASSIEPSALEITQTQKEALNDDRMARALDQLAKYGGRGVFFQLALRTIKLFQIDTSRVHFDTTSITFSGEYRRSHDSPRITNGFNKDHRPDLKQLVFGLNVSADGAVPLSHEVYSGNRTDDTVHCDNLDALRDLLARDDFIYVADSKLCTKENLAHLDGFGGKFVTVLPRTRKESSVFMESLRHKAGRWRKILAVENPKKRGAVETYSVCPGPKNTEEGYRLIWIKSSSKANLDSEIRQKRLEKAKLALKDLSSRINQRNLKTQKQIKAAANAILREHRCEEFLRVTLASEIITSYKCLRLGRPAPGDPKKRISRTVYRLVFKEQAVRLRQERNIDGVFPLVTNLPSKTKTFEVLQIYRYQPYLERRFENLKTEYSVAPVYLKTPERIVGFLHVYFLALMVASLIERELRNKMEEENIESLPIYPEERECRAPTSPRIFELFAGLDWFRHITGGEEALYPVELTDLQREVLRLLDISRKVYDATASS